MKTYFFALIAAAAMATSVAQPAPAAAQESGFGLGLILGDPTGLSLKGWTGARTAIDGAVGFGFFNGNHLYVHADFLWHAPLAEFERANMMLHFGVGPKLGFFYDGNRRWYDNNGNDRPDNENDYDGFVAIGARAPIGLTFAFTRVPLDVFVEASVGLWFVPYVDFDLDAAAGVRYWF